MTGLLATQRSVLLLRAEGACTQTRAASAAEEGTHRGTTRPLRTCTCPFPRAVLRTKNRTRTSVTRPHARTHAAAPPRRGTVGLDGALVQRAPRGGACACGARAHRIETPQSTRRRLGTCMSRNRAACRLQTARAAAARRRCTQRPRSVASNAPVRAQLRNRRTPRPRTGHLPRTYTFPCRVCARPSSFPHICIAADFCVSEGLRSAGAKIQFTSACMMAALAGNPRAHTKPLHEQR
jgi:hypothetical protein